jgi:hypothetical protein
MTRMTALTRHLQALAVFAICIGTGAALPLTLIGFQGL